MNNHIAIGAENYYIRTKYGYVRKMGMKKLKNQRKRKKILAVAARRFAQYGYAKTSVDDIAEDLGIGKATLYHYFRNKEDLFLQVIQQESEKLQRLVEHSLNDNQTPQEKLRIFLQIHFDYLTRRRHRKFFSRDRWHKFQPLLERGLKQFYDNQIATLKNILQEGISQKYFRPVDPNHVSIILLSLVRSFTIPGVMIQSSITREKFVNMFLNLISWGIELRS